jgi:hypothetical protein
MWAEAASWHGVVRDSAGRPLAQAEVQLRRERPPLSFSSLTNASGTFSFDNLPPGPYALSLHFNGEPLSYPKPLELERLEGDLRISGRELILDQAPRKETSESSGSEQLSTREVAGIPLNRRDFSHLLLLAAGTMTDTNGAANFTQQFAVNGQRGTSAVFSMDGIENTDPELGGASFSNFNVDAVQEICSNSGVMPAEIGHGAAGYTDVITKSGGAHVHGTLFEFVRNAAFDARNFFDRRSIANPGRIPPFARNEFGFTVDGPVVVPGLYRGANRTFFFGQYQGFRQVLGTTQILPVPTADERRGIDSTAFAGDKLFVPVNAAIAPVLARYPLPNDSQGAYGARTYATSAKVSTVSDQFSLRIDHRFSSKGQFFARFNLNNVDGPVTNPSQTVIDPSFATYFLDRQRSFGLSYVRTVSAHFTSETSAGFLRTTPIFPTVNSTQPGLKFGDGLYEAFNAAAGTVTGSYGNLIQGRQNFSWTRGAHALKMGIEVRLNRDTTVFAIGPNGTYTFGGGAAYSPVEIRSASGIHNIHVGDPLPDALTGLLAATPFSYEISVAPPLFAQGAHMGDSGIHRDAYNFYVQDAWKISPRVSLNYGLRYEVNSRIREPKLMTQGLSFGATQRYIINPQPPYLMDWRGWAPRLALDVRLDSQTVFHAGSSLTTLLPNLFQDDCVTGGAPFVVDTHLSAAPGSAIPFENAVTHFDLPTIYTPDGRAVFATGKSTNVPPNTGMDVQRFEEDLAARTPGHQIRALTACGMSPDFRNGYVATYTGGFDRELGDVKLSAAYVGTAGIRLVRLGYPNGYSGAQPGFAPYTKFDSAGRAIGGFAQEMIVNNSSHSTFHSLQASAQKSSARAGFVFQASYTFSKSLDDASAVLGGFLSGNSGTVSQTAPQDPRNLRVEKGPSNFDVTHVLALTGIHDIPLARVSFLQPLGRKFTSGWQIFSVTTLTSGSPFSVYSGIQQTGVGSNGADRPDQVGHPVLSTGRTVREDYFGMRTDNASFFVIPINVPDGTGPNHGRPGALGRNTFRGPAYHNFDVALIKDTPFGRRGGAEMRTLQFRAEFFNVFNLVNLGLPANILLGPGFGVINHTAGTSRQIQLSVKLFF